MSRTSLNREISNLTFKVAALKAVNFESIKTEAIYNLVVNKSDLEVDEVLHEDFLDQSHIKVKVIIDLDHLGVRKVMGDKKLLSYINQEVNCGLLFYYVNYNYYTEKYTTTFIKGNNIHYLDKQHYSKYYLLVPINN